VTETLVVPEWCIVANVRPEPHGRATSPGTRHFVAGAKIYCVNWMWGTGVDTVVGIGRHRGGSQLIELLMETHNLTNFRTKHVHRPGVLNKLRRSMRFEPRTQEWCENLAINLGKWFAPTPDLGERKELFEIALHLMATERGQTLRHSAMAALDGGSEEHVMNLFVLCDYLEQHGAALSYDDVVTTLKRQRDNAER
jgi:hypothetical protein